MSLRRNPRVFIALFFSFLIIAPIGPIVNVGSSKDRAKNTARQIDRALTSAAKNPANASVQNSYARMPLGFEANDGQFDSAVKFVSRAHGGMLFLTETEAVLNVIKKADRPRKRFSNNPDSMATVASTTEIRSSVLRMKLVSANRTARITGFDELLGKSYYFIGNDAAKWKTNVATFAKVKYEQVYAGVDLVYYWKQRELEYDLIVAPGADPRQIRIAFEGSESTRLEPDGSLLLTANDQETRQQPPIAYQFIGGILQQVDARYVLDGNQRVSFSLGRYRSDLPLIIDPVLAYSTYLGGTDDDLIYGIAADSSGNAYVTGYTFSSDFPGTVSVPHNVINVFVTKLNAAGTAVLYTSIIGGTSDQLGFAIAVDLLGNAYVTGETFSSDFPAVSPLQSYGGQVDAFIVKLNATGSSLLFSTLLGGSRSDEGNGIAVDQTGALAVTGQTFSTNFPTQNATQPAHGGFTSDGFVIKLSPAGSVVYSTYLGGIGLIPVWGSQPILPATHISPDSRHHLTSRRLIRFKLISKEKTSSTAPMPEGRGRI